MNKDKVIIGIDLGTTNSCVSFMEGQQAKIIENSEGYRTTPSVVFFDKDNKISVGNAAVRQAAMNPENTIVAVKRLIGKSYDDPDIKKLKESPYKIVASSSNDAWVQVNGKAISPQEISAKILSSMKKTAEDYFGHQVTKAVITVPAYFTDAQRQSTKDAGTIAGLEVVRIINEPTAAALAYGANDKSKSSDKIIAVYDLGGGTFDISIIEISKIDGETQVQVLATNGDTLLGGEDIDKRLVDYIIKDFKKDNGIDLSKDPVALGRIKEAAEKSKKELSTSTISNINLPFISSDASGNPKHLNISITRSQFNSLIEDIIDKTIIPCQKVIQDSNISKEKIDAVLLVGGQTRTPLVKEKVEKFFGKTPRQDINPDEAVAQGAAIQGGILVGQVTDVLLLDVTPLSLGIETLGGAMTKLIERNSAIPTKVSKVFTTAEDNQSVVSITVLQGERAMAANNNVLGSFDLRDILPAPRGIPQIEVSFDIDASGILHVSAKDKGTGKSQSVTIKAAGGLTQEQIDQAIKQAKDNEDQDREFRELITAKDTANQMLLSVRKHLNENKLQDQYPDIVKACDELEVLAKADNKLEIQNQTKKLQELFYPLMEKVYSKKEEKQNPEQNSGKDEIIVE